MAFAQLTYRESLRDIEACLRAQQSKLYHLGIRPAVARNTLANANAVRDWRIHADFAQSLIPAAAFWAVTIYNPADGTMPQTDQPFPSRNGLDKPQYNPDHSIDLYFGPAKPPDANEKNWIQTLRGKAFMVALRLYGSETAFFDQTWRPDDLVKVT